MPEIEAIYQGGFFKPVGEVQLPENQRVRLQIQPIEAVEILTWLAEVKVLRQRIRERHGNLPDSTFDIAEDRMRDV